MRGILYGIGTGPGDCELLTLKAVRLIRECDIVAVAASSEEASEAYKTALCAVPEITDKPVLLLSSPMTSDRGRIADVHRENAKKIEAYLDRGKVIAFLTLGDPSIYSTFGYIRDALSADGYETRTSSGVTSFSEAAARLGVTLAAGGEPLYIIPASQTARLDFDNPGTYVLMKPPRDMAALKEAVKRSGRRASAVVNCGMEGEVICRDIDALPPDAGYFAVIIVK